MPASTLPTEPKARVLIGADHRPTRVGMRLALEGAADCSEAGDADEAVAAALRDTPDVCLLDFDPPARGIEAAARITARAPGTPVVVMTRRLDEDDLVAAVRAGAIGYLPERVDPARLPFVVRGVLRGEAAVPRALVSRLIGELRGREARRRRLELHGRSLVELTEREWEVVDLLRQGHSTRSIGELLGISAVTVRRHAGTGYRKLGVGTRAELAELLAAHRAQP